MAARGRFPKIRHLTVKQGDLGYRANMYCVARSPELASVSALFRCCRMGATIERRFCFFAAIYSVFVARPTDRIG